MIIAKRESSAKVNAKHETQIYEKKCEIKKTHRSQKRKGKAVADSCSFWENLTKSYVAPPRGSATPPTGNPGSAPVRDVYLHLDAIGVFRKSNLTQI